MGPIELYLIYDEGGIWEADWRPMQGAGLALPEVTKADMDHALHGWTRPLVSALGPPPEGRLRLLPKAARHCEHARTCSLFDKKRCGILIPKMPWCFEPAGFLTAPQLVAEVVKMWRAQVYVLLVKEPPTNASNPR
jgi:hypothetical protein